jgi:hypothetical protein
LKQTKLCPALLFILAGAAFLALSGSAHAQGQLDFAVGLSTIAAPPGSDASGNHAPQSLTGGAYPSFSADFLLLTNFGVQGELGWKGGRGEWGGFQPFRPFFYDFNAMYQPKLARHTYLELLAGIGAQSTRFYTPNQICGQVSCQNYFSVNHFMGHLGAGIKAYPFGHNFFVRPEAHLYLVHDNQEFSAARAVRYGLSVGYTFGGR